MIGKYIIIGSKKNYTGTKNTCKVRLKYIIMWDFLKQHVCIYMTQFPIESRLYIQRKWLVNKGHITAHTSEKRKAIDIYISQSNKFNSNTIYNN